MLDTVFPGLCPSVLVDLELGFGSWDAFGALVEALRALVGRTEKALANIKTTINIQRITIKNKVLPAIPLETKITQKIK